MNRLCDVLCISYFLLVAFILTPSLYHVGMMFFFIVFPEGINHTIEFLKPDGKTPEKSEKK
jgi:hypothetical protein